MDESMNGTMKPSVILTGASQGTGRAIAQRLAHDGMHVLNLDLRPLGNPLIFGNVAFMGGLPVELPAVQWPSQIRCCCSSNVVLSFHAITVAGVFAATRLG